MVVGNICSDPPPTPASLTVQHDQEVECKASLVKIADLARYLVGSLCRQLGTSLASREAYLASKHAATLRSYAMAREKSSSAAWGLPRAA